MRIAWLSNGPSAPTGFGMVTRQVCARLAEDHDVHIIANYETEVREYRGCLVTPLNSLGEGMTELESWRPDAVIMLTDVWEFPAVMQHINRWPRHKPYVIGYVPLDGARPDGSLPTSWAEILGDLDLVVVMSRFAERVMADAGIPSTFIPHGVNLEVFRPLDASARVTMRHTHGIGDEDILFLSDCRNQPRKQLPRLLRVLKAASLLSSRLRFHLHTDPNDGMADTATYRYNIVKDVERLGLDQVVRFTPQFGAEARRSLSEEELAELYQIADAHIIVSTGEGFGIPTLQASSAGLVPFAPDFSANSELVAGHGVALPPQDYVESPFGTRRVLVDVEKSAKLLHEFVLDGGLTDLRRSACRDFAAQFSWEAVKTMWTDTFADLGKAPRAQLSFDSYAHRLRCDFVREYTGDTIPTFVRPRRIMGRTVLRDKDLVVVIGDDPDLHSLREIFPGLVVLIVDPQETYEADSLVRIARACLVWDPHNKITDLARSIAAVAGVPVASGEGALASAVLWLCDRPEAERAAEVAAEQLGSPELSDAATTWLSLVNERPWVAAVPGVLGAPLAEAMQFRARQVEVARAQGDMAWI